MSLACCLGLLQKFFLFSNVILPSKLSLMFHSVVFPVKIKQQTTKQIKITRYLNFLFAYICLLASKYRESFFDDKIIKKNWGSHITVKVHWKVGTGVSGGVACFIALRHHVQGYVITMQKEACRVSSVKSLWWYHCWWPLLYITSGHYCNLNGHWEEIMVKGANGLHIRGP